MNLPLIYERNAHSDGCVIQHLATVITNSMGIIERSKLVGNFTDLQRNAKNGHLRIKFDDIRRFVDCFESNADIDNALSYDFVLHIGNYNVTADSKKSGIWVSMAFISRTFISGQRVWLLDAIGRGRIPAYLLNMEGLSDLRSVRYDCYGERWN